MKFQIIRLYVCVGPEIPITIGRRSASFFLDLLFLFPSREKERQKNGLHFHYYKLFFLFFLPRNKFGTGFVQKETKSTPEIDDSPISGWFPD
jgi:hypothetical protein